MSQCLIAGDANGSNTNIIIIIIIIIITITITIHFVERHSAVDSEALAEQVR